MKPVAGLLYGFFSSFFRLFSVVRSEVGEISRVRWLLAQPVVASRSISAETSTCWARSTCYSVCTVYYLVSVFLAENSQVDQEGRGGMTLALWSSTRSESEDGKRGTVKRKDGYRPWMVYNIWDRCSSHESGPVIFVCRPLLHSV
jgi:hypothetical protein